MKVTVAIRWPKTFWLVRALACACGVVLGLTGTSHAATYYADASRADDSGDGTTLATAKKYIQSAVDLAEEGDTVLVAAGVYDAGTTKDALSGGGNDARVVVTKAITLKSISGKEKTHIVGAWDPDAANGLGPNAIRCVTITIVDNNKGAVIEGFTIRDGASHSDSDGGNVHANWGGGIYGAAYGHSFIVDCTIRNCRATRGGGMARATAVRTLFYGNYATSMGSAARDFSACNCVFTGQRAYSVAGFWNLVNCTFAGNDSYSYYPEASWTIPNVVNCVSVGNGSYDTYYTGINTINFTNSVIWTYKTVEEIGFTTTPENLATYTGDMGIVLSPATGDFRPRAGSRLVGAGSVAGLDLIPAKYRDKDFYGNPRTTDGTVSIGAVETPATPATQTFFFNYNSTVSNLYVNGEQVGRNTWINDTAWPVQVTVKPELNPGRELVCSRISPALCYRFPKEDGSWLQTLPRAGTEKSVEVLTNSFFAASNVYWTDPTADAATADGTEAHPFRTLQAAADKCDSGNNTKYYLIHCKPGTYAEGGATCKVTLKSPITYAGEYVLTNRLYAGIRNIFFRSTEGAAKTIVQGQWDTSESKLDDFGTGPAAVRCVCANSSGYVFGFMGFTLKDGAPARVASDSANRDYGDFTSNGGGAYFASQPGDGAQGRAFNHSLMDCVITNCTGSRGVAVAGGLMRRCRIYNCHTTTGGSGWFRSSCLSSCVIVGGEGKTADLLGQSSHSWNCTVYGTDAYCRPVSTKATCFGCVFDGMVSSMGNPVAGYENIGSLNGTNKRGFTSMTDADALLADAANGDFRPRADSPALGLFDPSPITNFCYMVADDISGKAFIVQNGKVTAGAYQTTAPVLNVTAIVDGEVAPSGTVVVTGDDVTLTVPETSKRKFLGYEVGGVFTETAAKSFTWVPTEGAVYTNALAARAVYATNWYVNATSGVDTNDGWTPETARKTLVAGVADAVPGDVVHAAAGIYNENCALQTSWYKPAETTVISNRVVVPYGVTLAGESAATTIIEGAPDPDTINDTTSKGTGPKAVRGVWLARRAKLRNVTVRNGRSNNGRLDRDDDCAGGVLAMSFSAADDAPWIEDCVITNCVGGRGGGARFPNCRRVTFIGNDATINGAAVREGSYYNCYFKNNPNNTVTLSYRRMENCTFDSDNSSVAGGYANPGSQVYNCVFTMKNKYTFHYVSNCVFVTGSTYTNRYTGAGAYVSPEGSNREVALADMKLTDGVPARDSVLVDAGDATLSDGLLGDCDVNGNPRVSNANRLDVGAFEYDWRPVYAKALSRTGRVTVTAADPAVALNAAGDGVVIPAGAFLALDWNYIETGDSKHVTAEVAEGGTLTVARNGGTTPLATATAGTTRLRFRPEQATDSLVFSSADADSVLANFQDFAGSLLIFR